MVDCEDIDTFLADAVNDSIVSPQKFTNVFASQFRNDLARLGEILQPIDGLTHPSHKR